MKLKTKMPSRRMLIWLGLGLAVMIALAWGMRSPAALVDTAEVIRDRFEIVVEDDGRTRVPDRYEVSAPSGGSIGRVRLEPGDRVARGDTLFVLVPATLDPRAGAQAEATLARAVAALQGARQQVDAAAAQAELADTELMRIEALVEGGHVPREMLDRVRAEARRAAAELRSAHFAVDIARHERDNAQAVAAMSGGKEALAPLQVTAPVDGMVLQRARQSEGVVQAGEPVLTLGSLDSLEVEIDVLSPDAVRIRPGMRVELERWGGDVPLAGRVARVEPSGFTKVSALGVEEQRVWVIVSFDAPRDAWSALGDAYRVEARFILWEGDDVVQAPASALFREGDNWAAYVVSDGRAVRREVRPGRRSGLRVEIEHGLSPGERVIMHPDDRVADGTRIKAR